MAHGGLIVMTAQEAKRLHVIQQVIEHTVRQCHAAQLLGRSVRQIRRLVQRIRAEGPRGIVHRLRGRRSNRRHPERIRQRVLAVYRARYADFGPTLAQEKLRERHRLRVGRETLRRWLVGAKLWDRQRRQPTHHQWRERKACCGEMVQVDGSHHAWLEGRGPHLVLMAYIDDATSRVFARFYDYEGTLPALDSFARYAKRYGLPQSVYVDRHTTYRSPGKRSVADELAGRARPQSQFERALAELGVQVIPAYSPQAKGRVERLFGTFQDRLVKELRLAGATTREEANTVLARYLPSHNHRFGCVPRSPVNVHRPCPAAGVLRRVLTIRQARTLRADNTVQHAAATYLLDERWPHRRPTTLQVERRLNGRLYLLDGARVLRYHAVATRPPTVLTPRPPQGSQRRRTPTADHPWRHFSFSQNRTVLLSQKEDISIGR